MKRTLFTFPVLLAAAPAFAGNLSPHDRETLSATNNYTFLQNGTHTT